MANEINFLSWQTNFKTNLGREVSGIDNEFLLFDNIKVLPGFTHPFRTDVTTFIICTKGHTRGKIGLVPYKTQAPCMITIVADEILQHEYISDDFEGSFIVMSKQMTDSLIPHISERLSLSHNIRKNPYLPLTQENLDLLMTYYLMLKKVADMLDNPHRKVIVQYLMVAFHYYSNSCLHKIPEEDLLASKQNESVEHFLSLAEKNFKTQRQVKFYADKVNLSPKYLSQMVKSETGKSVNNWIEDYVILEAKALLKSSKHTIQQISNELNFVDQSVFGKYFKRVVGKSPKQYREE